jgi:hypothetical protein
MAPVVLMIALLDTQCVGRKKRKSAATGLR